MNGMKITIPGQTIAKKNSQRIAKYFRKGKLVKGIRASNAYEIWEEAAILELTLQNIAPVTQYPVEVHFFFYRQNKRSFDLDNMICGSLDALQKAGILEDDTMNHVIPVIQKRPEGYGWAIDKDNPRTEIEIKEVCDG